MELRYKMADTPSPNKSANELPEPEVLKPQGDSMAKDSRSTVDMSKIEELRSIRRLKRGTYRPSHKSTFIGLGVVVGILAINAAIIGFVIKSQSKSGSSVNQSQVSISASTLDKLGVNRTSINNSGIKLIVNPDAQFNGNLQVNGNVSLAGQLKLNSKFIASDASLTTLEAGNTSLAALNVSGDGTVSNLNVRSDLIVAGTTRLQGSTVLSGLVTANGSINVSANLTVGGTLAAANLHVSSLVIDSTIILGGHFITQGTVPTVSAGSNLGTNGTVSISGNDASGTIAVNTGTASPPSGTSLPAGTVAYVTFHNRYSNTPHVVVSVVGQDAGSVYVNRSTTGFSIHVSNLVASAGYAFDYIVEQ